jgi:LmbE family N-acetylglucosaminyl deacetylase
VNHPYNQFVNDFVTLVEEARQLPLGEMPPASVPRVQDNAPRVLIFSPHPDDESILGGLALRLRREMRFRVTAVAVTQGSRVDRKVERLGEMYGACRYLGYELITIPNNGLANINPKTRAENPSVWAESVSVIAEIISYHRASIILLPHEDDFNTTHIGTNLLVLDALRTLGPRHRCRLVETEYWRPMADPNLMIESSPADVADLVAAISFHKGEVRRNPYHLHLPSWMSDNVRRGSELVGGQGVAAPAFHFATLYRVRDWVDSHLEPCLKTGILIPADGDLGAVFPW